MENIICIKSISYILGGSLLYQYNGVSGGWTSGLAAMFGFTIFIIGLNMIESGLDQVGRSGISLMRVGAIIGAIASLIDLIPIFGWLSGLGFMAAFIIILLGLIRLKGSLTIGLIGQSGASRIIAAMVISIIAATISIIPFLGHVLASFLALLSMYFSFSGWLRIQDGLMDTYEISPI